MSGIFIKKNVLKIKIGVDQHSKTRSIYAHISKRRAHLTKNKRIRFYIANKK